MAAETGKRGSALATLRGLCRHRILHTNFLRPPGQVRQNVRSSAPSSTKEIEMSERPEDAEGADTNTGTEGEAPAPETGSEGENSADEGAEGDAAA